MKLLRFVTCILVVCAVLVSALAFAGAKDPLFISVTTDDDYRSTLATNVIAKRMAELGHPLTLFFSDRGILVISKANREKFKVQQTALAELAKAGATLIACPSCMKHYRIIESNLLDGIKVGTPPMLSDALSQANTRTLVW